MSHTVVQPAWLHENAGTVKVVDVRTFDKYLNGHIPGAIWLDVSPARLLSSANEAVDWWKNQVTSLFRMAGINADDHVVAYEDVSGTFSAYLVWLADVIGVRAASMLDGGFNAWMRAGYEISGDPVQPEPSEFTPVFAEDQIVTAPSLFEDISSEAPPAIVDTRSRDEFLGGTIPESHHLEWTDNLTPEGTLKPDDELRALHEKAGIDLATDKPVVTFCGSGLRAAHSYVVLKHLGVAEPRNYGPSWSEWGRHPETPKQRPTS